MNTKNEKLMRGDIEALTSFHARKMQGIEFAGFLVREEEDAVYVTDPQGTWMIPRENILEFGPWESAHCIPEDMRAVGKPVRVTMKEDTIFYEIRPWRVSPGNISANSPTQITSDDVREIFSLTNGKLPVTEGGFHGELRLRGLERQLNRRLGFNPDVCSDPRAFSEGGLISNGGCTSGTGECSGDAGCRSDTDADF